MQLRLIVFLLSFITAFGSLFAQLTPAQAIAEMGRGINLGNTLEPPTESAWNNGPAQEIYFDKYVEAGFTNVRVPVRWDEHTSDTAPFTIDESWMNRVEEVIDWGLERDLYITLNGHHEDWLKTGYSNPILRARYDAIWEQIMVRFGDKSDKLLLEIINEPNGMSVAQVDDLNARILGIIRETNPTRLVIYGGNMYSNSEQLYQAAIPEDDYIIGYFHSYDPWPFAGQGNGTWGSTGDYSNMENKFQQAANWSAANDISIHVSEFGAVHECDYNSRMRYYAYYTEQMERHGFAFSVWDDGGMFGVLNRNNNTWPEVKDILMYTQLDSPDRIFAVSSEDTDGNPIAEVTWRNRATDSGEITVQRSVGNGNFLAVAQLPADATEYLDTDVAIGNTYTYRVVTFKADGTELQSYPSRIGLAGVVDQAPFMGNIATIPGRIEAENFDVGGEGVSYSDSEVTNIPGAYRPGEGVDVEDNGSGGFQVGYVSQGEWLEYTVNVTQTGPYLLDADLASEVGNGSMRISAAATGESTTITVAGSGTGGWTNQQNFVASAPLMLTAGQQIIRIDITGTAAFNIDFINFSYGGTQDPGIINYFDGLENAASLFGGNPAGMTYAVSEGVFTLTGDGTAPSYQNVAYRIPDPTVADVIGSNDLLYIRARTRSGNPASLRIDLVDESNYHTTTGSVTLEISGTEYQEYLYTYTGVYSDEAYGGTGCTNGPCSVNGSRISGIVMYPDPASGGFNEVIDIEYFSFGQSLVNTRDFADVEQLSIFPNPAKNQLSITYELPAKAEVSMLIFDPIGRLVSRHKIGEQPAGSQQTQLNVSDLPAGNYFMQLTLDGTSVKALPFVVK